MPISRPSIRFLALALTAATASAAAPTEEKMDPAGLEFFEKNIRPILSERCYECHSKEKGVSKGGLIMDSRQGMLAGGDLGPAVVPGDPGRSELVRACLLPSSHDEAMPPDGKERLTDGELAALMAWIRKGAR